MVAGVRDKSTSLRELMEGQLEFLNETTVLQQLWEDRGHMLDKSPKCHPEVAGEGHEYCFGKLKRDFRHQHDRKSELSTLVNRIRQVLENSLPIERVWKFSRKVYDYRQAYIAIGNGADIAKYPEIERLVRQQKSHRCCGDMHATFCADLDPAE